MNKTADMKADNEEFEQWFNKKLSDFPQSIFLRGDKPIYKISWEACAEQKNAIIEQQAKEIEALRERCKPSKVILIGDTGHYVSEKVCSAFEQQAKELEALRGFANDIVDNYAFTIGLDASFSLFKKHGLIDGTGNSTKLLTGEV